MGSDFGIQLLVARIGSIGEAGFVDVPLVRRTYLLGTSFVGYFDSLDTKKDQSFTKMAKFFNNDWLQMYIPENSKCQWKKLRLIPLHVRGFVILK